MGHVGLWEKFGWKNGIDSYFENGKYILPGVNSSWIKVRVNELEVFKIIILD